MKAVTVEDALRKRKFIPFDLVLDNARVVRVKHPECVMFNEAKTVAVWPMASICTSWTWTTSPTSLCPQSASPRLENPSGLGHPMSATPPPLPTPPTISGPPPLPPKKTLFHQIAIWGWLAPYVAFAAQVACEMELDAAHSSNPISPSNTAIAQGLLDGLLIVGVLLGAVSLCGIRRYGLANLKTKTIVGMVLCGGLLLRSTPGPQLHRNGSHPRFESEVTLGDGEEFRDFVFAIREYKRSPDGTQSLIVATTNKNSRLGFEMVLDATWKSQSLGKVIQVPLVMHEGSAAYRSIGPESDAFVQALDKLYGTQVHPQAMIKELRLHAVSLEGDPSDLSKGPVKLKVYCETGTDEDDAVFYTNIDLQKRKFTMKEKDPEFRSQIVQALQAH